MRQTGKDYDPGEGRNHPLRSFDVADWADVDDMVWLMGGRARWWFIFPVFRCSVVFVCFWLMPICSVGLQEWTSIKVKEGEKPEALDLFYSINHNLGFL